MDTKILKDFFDKNKQLVLIISVLLTLLFAVILSARTASETSETPELVTHTFDTTSFPSIDTGHYGLWGVDEDGGKILLKRFNYYSNTFRSLDGTILKELKLDPQFTFENYEITVEALGDRDEIQSGCILFEGKNNDKKINFSINLFDNPNGEFTLATPTDKTRETNEGSGVWFTNEINGDQSEPTLNVSQLPSCWIWASYVKYRGDYYRVGRFKTPNQEDSFSDYSFSIDPPINVPGEDFLRNIPNAPIKINSEKNAVYVAIEPKTAEMRLLLDYKPFINVLEYNFKGNERTNTLIELEQSDLPTMSIVVE